MKTSLTLLVFFTLVLLSPCIIFSQAGTLDPTFGAGGTTIVDVTSGYDQCSSIVIQPDQKIVIAGRTQYPDGLYATLMRLNTDGTPDDTFGDAGVARADVMYSGYSGQSNALALLDDGKLLFAHVVSVNNGPSAQAVTRFNSDGTVDTDFGVNGTAVQFALEASNYAHAILVQDDGKIIVCGQSQLVNNTPYQQSAVRFTEDGETDLTFGDNGIFLLDYSPGYDDRIMAAGQKSNGKIVFLSHAIMMGTSTSGGHFLLVQLNEDGTQDETFGEGGVALFTLSPGYDSPRGMAIREDDSMVIVGDLQNGNNTQMVLMSVNADGTLDESFGVSNGFTFADENLDLKAENVIIAADGKIIVCGTKESFYILGMVVRFNANGTLDTSFGEDGYALIDAYSYFTEGVAMQADGKIVTAGWQGYAGDNSHDFSVSRLLVDNSSNVESNTQDTGLNIYPNPADETFSIRCGGLEGIAEISISDGYGKIIQRESFTTGGPTLNRMVSIESLSPGVYTVTLRDHESFYIARIVHR